MMRALAAPCLAVIVATSRAQTPCQPAMLTHLAANARQIDSALLRDKVDASLIGQPKPEQDQIGRFKDALVAVADESIRCGRASQSMTGLQANLARLLHANQKQVSDGPDELSSDPVAGVLGSDLRIKVSRPKDLPDLRAVELSFGSQCGYDSILLLYVAEPTGFHRILRWQSPLYKSMAEAFGDFFVYGILPPSGSVGMRVAVAHGSPWCTSRFSEFKIDLLELGTDPNTPRVVWHSEHEYSRGDAVPRMRTANDGFELRLNTAAMDINTFEIPVVYRYEVTGDTVKRVQPIATNGRGFVNEWLEMPWDEAKGQVNMAAIESLKRIYDQFAHPKQSDESFLTHTDGPVRVCHSTGREFQVEIGATRETFVEGVPGGRSETLPSTYFRIRETGKGYELEAAGDTPDPRCTGPDLMPPKRK